MPSADLATVRNVRGMGDPSGEATPRVGPPKAIGEGGTASGLPEGGVKRKGIPEPGELLAARYRVLELLGRGGMGVVVAAYDARLDRRVAIKLLASSDEDGVEAQLRMLREAQAMARLSHPNVVAVYDSGTVEDGSVFIAMEYVHGQTLKPWVKQGLKTWREVLRAYVDAGRGLAAAHGAGLIHRDFKPDNVLVGQDGRVRVTDFGVARAEHFSVPSLSREPSGPATPPPAEWQESLTLPGHRVGTPKYMAPELWRGDPADARSDLFAFCLSLYEALYGQSAFPGTSLTERAHAQREGRLNPTPEPSPVPGWLRKVVLEGLNPEPARRPQTMEALLRALEADPERKRRERLLWGAALSATVGLVAVAAVGWGRKEQPAGCNTLGRELSGIWDDAVRARLHRALMDTQLSYAAETAKRVDLRLDAYSERWLHMRIAVCEATLGKPSLGTHLLARQEYCLSRRRSQLRALTTVLVDLHGHELVDKAVQASASLPPLEDCADEKALAAAVPLPEEPLQRTQVDRLQAQVDVVEALGATGQYAQQGLRAEGLLKEVQAVGYAPLEARALYVDAWAQDRAGNYKQAQPLVRQAAQRAAEGHDAPILARAWSLQAWIEGYRLGFGSKALEWVPVVDAAVALSEDEGVRAEAANNLGAVFFSQGRHAEARDKFAQALAVWETTLGPEHPQVAEALNNLAVALQNVGDYDGARKHLARALAIREKVLGPEHPDVAITLNNLGYGLRMTGNYEEARAAMERCLELTVKALGPEHPDVATSLDTLGGVLLEEGRYEEARARLEPALKLRETRLGADNPAVAETLENLGRAQVHLRHWDVAERHLQRALALRVRSEGVDNPDLALSLLGLGELRKAQGRLREAASSLERALKVDQGKWRAEVQWELAQALWESPSQRQRAVDLAAAAQAQWQARGHPRQGEVARWRAFHKPR